MVRKIKTAVAMALLFGASMAADAAGLGKLTVNSSLGQPLNAEIDLVSLQPGELENLTARVASPESFRDARIEYGASLRHLRFSIEKRANGQPYLKVTSVAPINEPFLDVLIEVTWPAGRIQREYPILLDPPGYAQGKVTPPAGAATSPPREAAQAAATPPASAPAASSSAPAASSSATPSAPAAAAPSSATAGTGAPSARAELVTEPGKTQASGDTYGPVQKGETLRKIAEEVKPADVSLEQMLVALYRENQAAFAGNNMNRLKAGQILKVPSSEQVGAITRQDANKEYRTQVADWRSYREQLAGGVAAIPARPETGTAASGRVTTAAVTPPAPPAAETKEVLKLSKTDAPGKAGAAAGKGGASNEARLNALQEEVIAKDKALKESQSRVSDLEKQIRDMQRLLELKGGGPAVAAKPGDTKVATAPTPAKPEPTKPGQPATVTPTPVPTPTTPPTTAAKPGEAPNTDPAKPGEPPKTQVADATKPGEAPKADATKPADPSKPTDPTKAAEPPKVADASKPAPPKTDPAKTPPKTDPKAAAKKPPPPEEGLLDNPWILAAAGGGLLLAGLGAFMFMRRRRQQEDMPNSAMTSAFPSDLKPGTNTSKPAAGGLVDTGNSSFLTDFDKTGPGTIDTDEVDPVAEAEVYIAYGRDAQAEEILKEAMARDRNRTEIPLKLLEIYHARKSATAFETVAKELKAQVGEDSPQWQKAAAMGAQIDPNNPLYGGASTAAIAAVSAPVVAQSKPDVDFDIEGSSAATPDATAPAPDFDLDLDGKSNTQSQASSSTLDFDLAPSASAPAADEPKKEEKPSFDFDLSGLDFPGSTSSKNVSDLDVDATKPASSASSTDFNLADLSLDAPAETGGGSEAVGTKLELAKAYLEIGDKDGAREILQEVAKEGSAAQREEASRLISSL